MDNTRIITLIGTAYTQNASGQHIPAETRRDIFCNLTSVSASEFFAAGEEGLRKEYRAIVFALEYNGEQLAELDGKRYSIYRTYRSSGDRLELYLGIKVGLQ